jgi:hypothetical protein
VLGICDLSHRRFDDGNVLLRRSAADSDAGDHLAFAGDWHAAAHRGVSTAGDGEEGIELSAWLHEGDEVSGAHADEGGRVGLSLGELEGECGAPVMRWVRTTLPWMSMTVTATGTFCARDSASTASAMFFAVVSRSMVVCFLPEN